MSRSSHDLSSHKGALKAASVDDFDLPLAAVLAAAVRTAYEDETNEPSPLLLTRFFKAVRMRAVGLWTWFFRSSLMGLDPAISSAVFARAVHSSRVEDVARGLKHHPEWARTYLDELLPGPLSKMVSPWSTVDCALDALSRDCSPQAHAVLRLLLAYGADPLASKISPNHDTGADPALLFDPLDVLAAPRRWPKDLPWDHALRIALKSLDKSFSRGEVVKPLPEPGTPGFLDNLGYTPIMERGARVVSRGFAPDTARWADVLCDLVAAALAGATARQNNWNTWDDLWGQAPLIKAQSVFYPGFPQMLSSMWERRLLSVASGLYSSDSWEAITGGGSYCEASSGTNTQPVDASQENAEITSIQPAPAKRFM
jgi:hypothetical protein